MVTGATDHELHAGRVLGPYELLVPVGSGGMAHVWAARHRATQRVYALKMLLSHLAENSSFRDMFFDEARIASRIHHENVCETYELVELDGILTIVMEWVDGTSLVRVLRPGPDDREDHPTVALPIRHAAKILAETCAGLQAAHDLVDERGQSLSVVHRDVSPHNVLLTSDGRVKVTDFGVAKALGKLHMTIAGQVKGKLAYMAPEQLVGGGVDRRTDVFALGSVLYEATTGRKPFQGDHDPQVMSAIIMGNYEPPSVVMKNYPPALEAIVMRAMATEPEARFSTALQFKQALDGWLASSGPTLGAQQVAVLLHERCGAALVARAESVSLPPPRAPGSTLRIESGSAMEVDRRAAGGRSEMSAIWAVLAALVGLMLGLGVLVYVREIRKARSLANAHRIAMAEDVADAGARPSPTTSSSTPLPVPTSVMIVGDIDEADSVHLRVPDGAHVFVGNQELPAGVVNVSRPEAGSVSVIVKAEGKNDVFVTIDAKSPDEIEVKMTGKRRPAPSNSTAMPPNPYE